MMVIEEGANIPAHSQAGGERAFIFDYPERNNPPVEWSRWLKI